jgi:hypothetical protein
VDSPKCSFRMGLVMVRVSPRAGPAYRAARLGRRASEFAARFVRTIWACRTDSTTSEKKPLTTMSQRSPANPPCTPNMGNHPYQYGQRLPMCSPVDARTVARVHRLEVIQEDPRRL